MCTAAGCVPLSSNDKLIDCSAPGAKQGLTYIINLSHLTLSKLLWSFGDYGNMSQFVNNIIIWNWIMLQWQGNHDVVIITWSCYDRLMITCVFVSYTNQCLFIVALLRIQRLIAQFLFMTWIINKKWWFLAAGAHKKGRVIFSCKLCTDIALYFTHL